MDLIERWGNKVPHPAVLFLILIGAVALLSHVLHLLGISVSYERINAETHEIEAATTVVNSLLTADGIRFVCTSVVPNFINFGPVGIILVAMIGVGLAERAGLIGALIRKIVVVAPPQAMTAIIVTLGVASSIASDAGHLVLIPLGATAFYSLGRHPLAGLSAAFAGVAAAFGANFLVKPIDGILVEMTNDAIHIVDPAQSIDTTANFYFGVASSLLLIAVCSLLTTYVVEPRLGAYSGTPPVADKQGLSAEESRGLRYALWALAAFLVVVALLAAPPGAPLRNPETGEILGQSPFMDSLVFLIMAVFLTTGLAYGVGAGTIRRVDDAIDAITRTIADLAGLVFLFFVISQFVAYFNYSNMGTILAVKLADILKEADPNSVTLLLAFIVLGVLMSIPVPNILPKMGNRRAGVRAAVPQARSVARGGARSVPGERFSAQRDQSAAAPLCAGRRLRAALAAERGRGDGRGDDAALHGCDAHRVDAAVLRLGTCFGLSGRGDAWPPNRPPPI